MELHRKAEMEPIAIIPARGGSTGIPRKNLQQIGGESLLGHTVRAARRASSVGRVFVTTDDAEIADAAADAGAEVIQRPAAFASDTASSEGALLHALDCIERNGPAMADTTVFLQCTSPFTTPLQIDGAVDLMRRESADCVFSAAPFHGFVWRNGETDGVHGINHDFHVRQRRQDRPMEYLETGAIYAFSTKGFRQWKHRFFGKVLPYVVPPSHALEIDTPMDLELARRLAEPVIGYERLVALLQARQYRALVMDFDGVLTNNKVMVDESGRESVICDRGDGMGLAHARALGIRLCVLSKEKNPVVEARCRKLGVECFQGIDDKYAALQYWAGSYDLSVNDIIFVGNDVNDIDCVKAAGLGVVVADAHAAAKGVCDAVLPAQGGAGAIRILCDALESARDAGPAAR
ncbi:MAG: acylneuraminate cytidylyltransferase [Alphaproteobacteria bacterium]|nr:acylneuraminate cytidylyltransferase [Alphaproteobacteria bacterium]